MFTRVFSTSWASSDRSKGTSIDGWAPLCAPRSLQRARGLALRVGLLCVLLLGSPGVGWGADFDVNRFMHELAEGRVQQGTFVERKYLGMLERPLESSGELVYRAPDHLEKHTLLPQPEVLILEGDMLTLSRGTKKQTVWLYQYPEIGALVACVRSLLACDQNTL